MQKNNQMTTSVGLPMAKHGLERNVYMRTKTIIDGTEHKAHHNVVCFDKTNKRFVLQS